MESGSISAEIIGFIQATAYYMLNVTCRYQASERVFVIKIYEVFAVQNYINLVFLESGDSSWYRLQPKQCRFVF